MEIKAKKSLGQNFLKDDNVLNEIISNCTVAQEDLVIEIGPGKGALTKKLKNFNADILAFEIDERLKETLNKIEDDKTRIVFKDFMQVDLNNYITNKYKNIHIIANIPYYITNLIIRKLITSDIEIQDITLMVQKEVAERLSSKPGHKSYGALTIYSNLEYDVIKLFDVSKYSFDPVPKVDSSIIRFTKKNQKYDIKDKIKFIKLVNDSFQNKRKTLKNNLKAYNWDKIYNILKDMDYNEKVRAEELLIEVFVRISNEM